MQGLPHSSHDIVAFGPRPAEEFGEQPALARSDRSAIHHDVELTVATLLELHRDLQPVPDQCSETRRIRRRGRSRVAVHYSNIHGAEYTNPSFQSRVIR